MPKIKVDHVVSFSSEDPVHLANNLLNPDPSKKWKCQNAGETSAFIILQLEKAKTITSIDIGNEHSAFIEVLVARSGSASKDSDYKVLLVMSSFMTPVESRQSTNKNQVRMFTSDQLAAPERNEKWDRVKIVCTQPFNRHVQYGLSFITLHSAEEKTSDVQKTVESPLTTVGKFAIRPPSPSGSLVGSSFAKWKEEQGNKLWTDAAAILQATTTELDETPKVEPKKVAAPKHLTNIPKHKPPDQPGSPQPRNRIDLLYSKDDEEPSKKIDKIMEAANKEISKKKENEPIKKKKTEASKDSPSQANKRKTISSMDTSRKKPKQQLRKPFSHLLEGVSLVISGIQNPDRAMIRSMALNMGAKYEPDWKASCTHLICAFSNTPKFNQVRGKGKIVTKKWIEDCHVQRKRLPWRRYALDKNDHGKAESEEEILEEVVAKTRNERIEEPDVDNVRDSGSDTEAEVARIKALQQTKLSESPKTVKKGVYDDDTDEEILERSSRDFEELPQFFKSVSFYLDPKMDLSDRNYLTRCITAYGGSVETVPNTSTNLIITDNKDGICDKSIFQDSVVYLNPEWVCNSILEKQMLPHEKYQC